MIPIETLSSNRPRSHWLTHYWIYFIFSLLSNAFLLSFYVVMVSVDHISCMTKSDINITEQFEFFFVVGTVILALDTFNSAIPCIYFRAQAKIQRDNQGQVVLSTEVMA